MTKTLKDYLEDFEVSDIRYELTLIVNGQQTMVRDQGHYAFQTSDPHKRPQDHTVTYGNLTVPQLLEIKQLGNGFASFELSPHAHLVVRKES